jgi:hypothetical protein
MRIMPKNAGGDVQDSPTAEPAGPTGDVAVGKPEVARPAEGAEDADDSGDDSPGRDPESSDPAEGG